MSDNLFPLIVVWPDRAALAQDAAERFVHHAAQAIAARGRASIALSGGSTPRDLFVRLARPEMAARVDWARVHLFWGDERAVPPDDPASNYRMAREALLAHVPAPPQNVHRIPAERPAAQAARDYEIELRAFFEPGAAWPRFDLILLGLGSNGHTASLFPHTRLLDEASRWVASEYIAEVAMDRITLSAPAINAARAILFLVTGADKAETARAVITGQETVADLPARLIRPGDGEFVWLLDREAAAALPANLLTTG
jgi:6-phosphogluconolactonase